MGTSTTTISMIDFLFLRRFPNEPSPSALREAARIEAHRVDRVVQALQASAINVNLIKSVPVPRPESPEPPLPRAELEARQQDAERKAEVAKRAAAYREELCAKSLTELQVLYQDAKAAAEAEWRAEAENAAKAHEQEVARKERELFIYQPIADADFDYYSRLPTWTLDEVVSLLLGKKPEILAVEQFLVRIKGSKFELEFNRLSEIARRAFDAGDLQENNPPWAVLEWAAKVRQPIPPALAALLPSETEQKKWPADSDAASARTAALEAEIARLTAELEGRSGQKPPSTSGTTRKLQMAQKLLFGIAKAKYDINFDATKKQNTRGIIVDLAEAGIEVDDETLLNHLRSGSEEAAR